MDFTTYENTANPHVSIHRTNCSQVRKRGGVHQHDNGKYEEHATYADALAYATRRGLPLKVCSFCQPNE